MVKFVTKDWGEISRERKTMICLEADCVSRRIPKGSIHHNLRQILGYGNPYKHRRRATPDNRYIAHPMDRGETGTCNPMRPPSDSNNNKCGLAFLFYKYSAEDGISGVMSSGNEEYIKSCIQQEGKDIQKRRLENFKKSLETLRRSYTFKLYNEIVFPHKFGSGKSGGVWSEYLSAIRVFEDKLDKDKQVIIINMV